MEGVELGLRPQVHAPLQHASCRRRGAVRPHVQYVLVPAWYVLLLSRANNHVWCVRWRLRSAGGKLQVHMKPCPQYGVASAIWLFNYSYVGVDRGNYRQLDAADLTIGLRVPLGNSVHMCDPSTETCSAAYTAQCCTSSPCTTANDVCEGVWVDNQEMDIELPTSDAAQRAFNPNFINFQNMRFSTYTALASKHGSKCGVVRGLHGWVRLAGCGCVPDCSSCLCRTHRVPSKSTSLRA